MFVALTVALTRLGTEFGPEVSAWYQQTNVGAPANFLLFVLLTLVVIPFVAATPRFVLSRRLKELGLWRWVVVGWATIGLAIALGILRRAPELFADWRNLVVMSVTVALSAKWLAAQPWRRFVLTDFAIAFGLLALPDLVSYFIGEGRTMLGVRTTVVDGTTLYTAAFSAITAAWYALVPDPTHSRTRVAWLRVAGLASSLLVLLSFRRSFWLVWIIGLLMIFLLALRRRRSGVRIYASLTVLAILLVTATVAIGTEVILERVTSFLPTATGQYAVTNQDHVNDIIDAWKVIGRDPLLGLGIGSTYETELISDWKQESFEVHNAVLHVWLKFGLVGAVIYVILHWKLVQSSLRHASTVPIAAFITGEFLATTFGTWPYGSFQNSIFHGLLLAALVVNGASVHSRHAGQPPKAFLSGTGQVR